ncbi:MAG: GH92 family glycosyl hydrolase, partial [Limisphaerales bacterium]
PCANDSNGKAAFPSTFSHTNEIAQPGYYAVRFTNGIFTELTVTTRTGFGRFTYPAGSTASMLINAGSAAPGTVDASILINTNAREVSGWATQQGFCGSGTHPTVYFDAVFDHPFAVFGVWTNATLIPGGTNATAAKCGAYLSFDLPGGGVVLARTAISYVSVANAQMNLQTESPASLFNSAGFDAMAGAASNVWNNYLNKIQVSGGTAADTATFYTMIYHALQAPSVVSDVNNQYMGFDGRAHTTSGFTKYEFFSGWDIYRNECQFLAMMDPARAGDMAQSLVQDAQDCGAMPRWSVPNGDSGVMMGDPATPIIADFYAFGATNFDTAAALADMVNAAVNPNVVASNGIHERDAERDYLNLGFVPEYKNGGYGPVSMTLEYDSADCALARFAQALGDFTNYWLAMNRAQAWRNLFNPGSGYLQMRRCDGLWSPGFVDNNDTYDNYQGYVEGTAAQYTWMVPFNLASLTDLLGGARAASARLDTFFTLLNDGTQSAYSYMGNEPCSEAPWIYSYLGEPYKSCEIVRRVMTQLFSTAPGGLPGNDDLGQMASWYVLAALGMHPEIPGDDSLVLVGPLFPEAIIHLTNGDVTITANGAGDNAPYVQSLMVNGQPSNVPWIRYGAIANGATLAFTVSTLANTNWGADPSVAPPSYMDGMTAPPAPDYLWGTGLETNEIQPAWTNTVDSGPYPAGGITNVGPILGTLSGPELGVRSENSQSGRNELMYSGDAQGGAQDYAGMKVFDLSGQNATIIPGMRFSYWIFPQSPTNDGLVSGNNSLYVALDLIFADGTALRDSGLTNQYGVGVNPTNQAAALTLDTWNYINIDLTPLAGKTVSRIDLDYDQPNSSGGYRGYVDDVALTTAAGSLFGTNLALGRYATASSQERGYPASYGNDGSETTRWSANDGTTNQWWQVDLGALCNLTGDEVLWQFNDGVYDYTVAVSSNEVNWTTVINKTSNTSPAQDQADMFNAIGRYVRITVTGLPPGAWASFWEFRVFGSVITVPPPPGNLQALGGYGIVSLNWSGSPGAAFFNVGRATRGGAEQIIATTTGTNYLDAGLQDGVAYYYTVSAQNAVGVSPESGEASATPLGPAPGSYAAAIAGAMPIAYWPLSETNGQIARDLVGGNNGAYIGGVTLGEPGPPGAGFGPADYSANFNGTSGYVDVPEGPLNITNAITVMAWVDVPASSNFRGVIGHGDASWRMTIGGNGDPGASDANQGDATSSSSIVGTGWHMMAYTFNGVPNTTNNGSLFVDGKLVAHDTVPAVPGDGDDVWIGGSPDYGVSRLLPGNIAQAAVFTNALSAAQILALYNAATNALPVSLTMMRNGRGGVTLSWPQGALLQATNLLGPWTPSNVSSPYIVMPTNSAMFFRVTQTGNPGT